MNKANAEIDYRKELINIIEECKNSEEFGYLHGMILSLGIKDPYTQGHSYRVAYYALAIAYQFKYPDLSLLYLGALVHDVGKVGIPDTVLLKPTPFTYQERKIMDYHPTLGKILLEPIQSEKGEFFRKCAYLHHERINGKGYPLGLKGDEIPIEANIIAVADVFDALITERPYKKAKSIEETMDIIKKGKGKAYFPELVDAAEEIIPKVYKNPYYHIVSLPEELETYKKESFFKDELTGLYKYEYVKNEIVENIDSLKNDLFILIDIKELAFINLQRGWAEGDRIIERIANSLKKLFKYFTRVYGGKFFGILERKNMYEFVKSLKELERVLDISLVFVYEPISVKDIDKNTSNIDYKVATLEKRLEKMRYIEENKKNNYYLNKRNSLYTKQKTSKQGLKALIKNNL